MQIKKAFLILIPVLAYLGVYFGQPNIPNQQVVVQFTNASSTVFEIDLTINSISEALELSGATEISINRLDNGSLKITYYSSENIGIVKNRLSKIDNLGLPTDYPGKDSKQPEDGKTVDYQIEISEIASDGGPQNMQSTQLFEFNRKVDRSYLSKLKYPFWKDSFEAITSFEFQLNCCYGSSEIAISKILTQLPDFRAGPIIASIT